LAKLRRTTTLAVVYAQTVDQNLGWPLQKLLSYNCSTTLLFKVLKVLFENFEQMTVNQG
jgi:hypothetical protein